MDRESDKEHLLHKLARCGDLTKEFRSGPTAEMIRDLDGLQDLGTVKR